MAEDILELFEEKRYSSFSDVERLDVAILKLLDMFRSRAGDKKDGTQDVGFIRWKISCFGFTATKPNVKNRLNELVDKDLVREIERNGATKYQFITEEERKKSRSEERELELRKKLQESLNND